MTRKTFSCDVCQTEYGPPDHAAKSLVGIRFDGSGIVPQLQAIHHTETHVCRRCLWQLYTLATSSGLDKKPEGLA